MDRHPPELVIGLAHGGILPTKATEVAWTALTGRSFPPCLYTNLGREKVWRYQLWRREQMLGWGDYHGPQSGYTDVVHFLTWLEGQIDWLDAFRKQIEETLGRTPQDILVIDEGLATGTTLVLAVGLLERLYPQAEIHFLDGPHFDWRHRLGRYWLSLHAPHLLALLESKEWDVRRDLWYGLYEIASGTEDISPDLLTFRPLSAMNDYVIPLIQHLPSEQWLSVAGWIEDRVLSYIRRRAAQSSLDEVVQRYRWDDADHEGPISSYLVLKHIHRWGQITLAECTTMLRIDEGRARELLDFLVMGTRIEQPGPLYNPIERSRTSGGPTYGLTGAPEPPELPLRQGKNQRLKRWMDRRRRKPGAARRRFR